MSLSVVIPTLNGGALFQEVLKRVLTQEVSLPLEVLCIDSGSDDGTPEFALSLGARVIRIDRGSFNHGLTRNRAIKETSGEYVVLTVQDALPLGRDWLKRLVQALAENERAAGAYSRQVPREDCDPIIRDRLMHWSACRPERAEQFLPPGTTLDDLKPMERLALISFDNVSSCIRRALWEEVPFQQRNFGEDLAWGLDVINKGYSIIYEPASAVVHSHNNSLWYEFRRIYADHQNLNRLIGLTTVPRVRDIFTNARGAFCHYRQVIQSSNLPLAVKWYKKIRAFPYAYLENAAQFLGASLHKKMKEDGGPVFYIDEWLKKGV